MEKPPSCHGCPFYGTGQGFVPDEVNPKAIVSVLNLWPENDEVRGMRVVGYGGPRDPLYERTDPRPLIGHSGFLLESKYLPLAGLKREDCSFHNLIKCIPSKLLPTGDDYEKALSHCTQAHLQIPRQIPGQIGTVVGFGETWQQKARHDTRSAWSYTQGKGYPISEWRGFIGPAQFDGRRVFGVEHPANLLRDPHGRFIARMDFKRLRSLQNGQWPNQIPAQTIASPATRSEFCDRLEEALQQDEIVVDTEFIPDKRLLTHIGAAWRHGDILHGFQLEWINGSATRTERAIFMEYWPQLCERVSMAFWNAKADIPIIEHNLGCTPRRFQDPMQAHAVLWPDMDHDYGFVASIYGKYNKLKHLARTDMLLYHWGDLIDLVWIWEALKEEFTHDQEAYRKYQEQNLKLIPIILQAESRGIRVNHARITTAIPQYRELIRYASECASVYCGYPINIGSSKQVIDFLQTEGITLKSIDKDIIATQRTKYLPYDSDYEEQQGFSPDYVVSRMQEGAHPLLELRVMYAKNAKIIDDYLTPLSTLDRFYHEINIHTQAGGRHSVSRLGTIPPELLDIVIPDHDEVFIGFDWDQQEPRIQRAESGSKVLGAAFDNGEDIHTTFLCQLYGWQLPTDRQNPHTSVADTNWRQLHNWQGKDDPRRRFAKETRYEINYGGNGTQAAKKAVRMGIQPAIAKRAAQVLLESDPELMAWFRRVEKDVDKSHIVHSWDGGRRVWYWVDNEYERKEMYKQARNFICQGGGAGLHNLTIVEISEKVKEARYVYGRHDSQVWRTLFGKWPSTYTRIKEIACQPRLINGMMVSFPASFYVMFPDGRKEKINESPS